MFGSNILEIGIGLMFIYLFLSLLCTIINEAIAAKIEQRGKTLLEGVKNLLNDPEFTKLAQDVYNHGLVCGVMEGLTDLTKANRLPSYIAPSNFALALIDILGAHGAGRAAVDQKQGELELAKKRSAADRGNSALGQAVADAQIALDRAKSAANDMEAKITAAGEAAAKLKSLEDFGKIREAPAALQAALEAGRALASEYPNPLTSIENGIEALPTGHTKQSLLVLVDKTKREMALVKAEFRTAEQTVEKLRLNLEGWYNDAMDRFSGWYKRWTRQVTFVLAVFVVGFANADTIMLANRLARDSALRTSINAAADTASQKIAGDSSRTQSASQALLDESEKLNLPLGWVNPLANGQKDPFAYERVPATPVGWLLKCFGLLITILAVSLGAPFWFDTLSKFMNVRAAGKLPDTGQSASS